MINEIWKPVVGYEGLYEVSNYGRVKSLAKTIPGLFGSTIYDLAAGKPTTLVVGVVRKNKLKER